MAFFLLGPIISFAGAGCAHHAAPNAKPPTASTDDRNLANSPDGKWAVVSQWDSPNPDTGKRWQGIIEKNSGRRVFTVTEYDLQKPGESEGELTEAQWSRDPQLVALQVRHGHWSDELLVVKYTGREWAPIHLEAPEFKGWESSLDLPRGHHATQAGSWIDSAKWQSNGVLHMVYQTNVSDDDIPDSAQPYFEAGDYRFIGSHSQVRWHSP